MKFTVRYWSSLLPKEYRNADDKPRWVDYSIHPASKIGLRNALLALHDRLEILGAHGGMFECAVFVREGGRERMISQQMAENLFASLPHGEINWLDIRECLLPWEKKEETPPSSTDVGMARMPEAEQLSLFERVRTPYDDIDEVPHGFDIDI